jgi:hypothetical protein
MLEKGDAPATEFEIEPGTDGRFVILWRTDQTPNPSPSTEVIEKEIAGATAEADPPPATTERVGEPSQDPELAAFQTPRLVAELARRGYRSTQPRQRRSAERPAKERRPSKASELDQAAARGVMPEKPIVTSATNQHYQKRFDRLAELAAVGDWAAIAAYEVKGNNTYAKEVARYRDRLLAAHAAQEDSAAVG